MPRMVTFPDEATRPGSIVVVHHLADFSKNYFSPAEFETAVRSALQVSDGYVWIYSERPKWWTKEMLPQAYVKALAIARKAEK
jgi:hypothetical protein